MEEFGVKDLWDTLKIYIGLFLGFILIVVVIAGVLAFTAPNNASSSSTKSDSLTCRSCGRSFSDSANKKSIRSTNMCSNCYRNYSYVKGGKLDNHEHQFDNNDLQTLSETA